jgi:hypothetical protein
MPTAFELQAVTIAPACERPYDEREWRDTLVLVQHGTIELESLHGIRRRFGRGTVLCLAGLSLRALCNRGKVPARVITVTRKPMSSGSSGGYTFDPRARRCRPWILTHFTP